MRGGCYSIGYKLQILEKLDYSEDGGISMRRTFNILLALVLSLSLVLVACTTPEPSPTSPAPPPVPATPFEIVTLNYIHIDVEGTPQFSATHDYFRSEVERLTSGRVKVKIHPRGALGPAVQNYDLIRDGVADIGNILPAYNPGRFPALSAAILPFAWTNGIQSSLVMDVLLRMGVFDGETAEVKLLSTGGMGMYHLFTGDKQAASLADMERLKVRSPGDYPMKATEALGMVPVTMDLAEGVTALQTGVIDGVILSYGLVDTFGYGDFVKYVTELGLMSGHHIWVMNKKSWGKLSEQDQQIVQYVAVQAANRYAATEGMLEDVLSRTYQERGVEINRLSTAEMAQARNLTAPVYDLWVSDLEAKGIAGEQMLREFEKLREQMSIGWQPR